VCAASAAGIGAFDGDTAQYAEDFFDVLSAAGGACGSGLALCAEEGFKLVAAFFADEFVYGHLRFHGIRGTNGNFGLDYNIIPGIGE
jgi:hypothetical protein